jgi:hypothetical protein
MPKRQKRLDNCPTHRTPFVQRRTANEISSDTNSTDGHDRNSNSD